MFKNLRDKISVSDSNSKNKPTSNSNTDENDDTLEGSRAPGEHTLSRFSSISSLVSDVGSVFSKAKTNAQHGLSSNRNAKPFNDYESMSEYDDSIIQGGIITKEELLQRYQKAQSLAKRYKTRSLEVVECYKQLELENTKLTQTLTESQDCSFRRMGELREQIELDKKGKYDVEENYQLMLDEKIELVNVLRLQISLLKEGKDLPTELESQIKERYDMEIQMQKKKDDEIKELKSTMSQRENLLQRCKEKITSLNTELAELKLKSESIQNTSTTTDSCTEQFHTDLAKQRSQHVTALENIQREHSERIKIMLCDFDEKKALFESDIRSEYQQEFFNLKKELNDFKDKTNRLSQDNERLEEQVNIKTKIIEDLMTSQDSGSREIKEMLTMTVEHDIANESFKHEINSQEELQNIVDLKDEIKFLTGRVKQMEELKLRTEEETSKTEEELKKTESIIKREREDYEIKCNSYQSNMDAMKIELSFITSKWEEQSIEVTNLNSLLTKNKEEVVRILQDYQDAEERNKNLELQMTKTSEEKSKLSIRIDAVCKDNEDLEQQLQSIRHDYEKEQTQSKDQEIVYKQLRDKCDELSSVLEKEIFEKNNLLQMLNGGEKNTEICRNDDDSVMLKIVEMRQVYDQQIEDGKQQLRDADILLNDRTVKIQEMERNIEDLTKQNEAIKEELTAIDGLKEERIKINNDLEEYKSKTEDMIKEKEALLKNVEENLELIKEKEHFIKSLESENENLLSEVVKLKDLTTAKEKMQIESEQLRMEIEQYRLKQVEFVKEIDTLVKLCSAKEEQLQNVTNEKVSIGNIVTEAEMQKNDISKENQELEIDNNELKKEIAALKDNMSIMGHYERDCISLKNEYVLLQNQIDELQKNKDELIRKYEQSLKVAEEKRISSAQLTESVEERINVFKKYVNIFLNWNDKVVTMSDCGDKCDLSNSMSKEYWTEDLREGCNGIEELSLLGRSIERILLSWEACHSQLHEIKSDMSTMNNLMQEIKEFCSTIHDVDKVVNDEDILQRLSDIRVDFDKRKDQLSELEILLRVDHVVDEDLYREESPGSRSQVDIIKRVIHFKDRLKDNEVIVKSLQNEKEELTKKMDKMSIDRVQHFKALTKMFELSDVDFEQNNFVKMVMKGLKDYAKRSNNFSKELKDAREQLDITMAECLSKETELFDLRETLSTNNSKLVAMIEERDKSIQRLDEFIDEKRRIDEEKQSLHKELVQVLERIDQLKIDYDIQRDERLTLERLCDVSLEKVKVNYLILEESYKNEIEKLCGFKWNVDEQTSSKPEESFPQLTEKNQVTSIKLDEVLKQSQQLLMLNNRYKELFDVSKTETSNATESLKLSESKLSSTELELHDLRSKNESLTDDVRNLKITNGDITREQENLKIELLSLTNEKIKSVERLVHLQSVGKSDEVEKSKYLGQISELETKIRSIKEELTESRGLLEKEKCEFVDKLDDERKNASKLQCDIEEKTAAIQTYKTKIEALKMKMKDLKADHEREVFEIKQQFSDDKSTFEDDHNSRVKKLAKDFNEKMLQKEQDFQKTFQDALDNIRRDESRHKSDLKSEIETLNGMVIELEADRNGLMSTISDSEEELKRTNTLLQTKESQLQSLLEEISSHKLEINELIKQLSKMTYLLEAAEEKSKLNETISVSSCYEEPLPDTVNANDHDILQMHCADVEEQVKQLHQENMNLKQTLATSLQISASTVPAHEDIILASKSHSTLASQRSVDDASIKSVNMMNSGNSLRSQNNSCSEYQFCPYPITDATEYQYLRDILVKYMTGLETNTLARVLCTVMKFSRDETDRIVRFEQDKKRAVQIQIFPR